ncbi:MFS transporter [Microvirga pudoricolor]|uniref:MFS transporter n=1 Tax=Microvirga pudoricolor TaxID=2778729 RepID=UPI001951EE05|nr:MFS transporter [Microvirga pudoricolor]MBM6595096.1 MFS transporter [Microvirga pudoricolor]
MSAAHLVPPDGLPTPRRYWALLAIAIAVVMAVIDASLVNLALPAIAADFSEDPALAVWTVGAYQLAVTISLFPLSSLGDRIGYREIYCGGLLVFTLASLACAISPGLPFLIAARVCQGLGASGIMSVNLALVRFIYPRASLGRGIGYNTLIVALSATAGPSVSSLVLSAASWPWLFLLNIPLGIVAISIGFAVLPKTPKRSHAFDMSGALISALAFTLLMLAIDGLGRERPAWATILMALCGGLGLAWLFYHQTRQAHPIIPLDLLRRVAVRLAAATAVLSYIVQGLMFTALPFFLHVQTGFSALETGLAMTPWPMAIAIVSPFSGRLSDHLSAGVLGTVGLALLTVGVSCIALSADPSVTSVMWQMALCGVGFALFQVPNSKAIVIGAPLERSGAASAIQSAARLIGQTVGAALVSMVFGLSHSLAAGQALYLAMIFALMACSVSAMRLRPAPPGRER